MHKSYQDVIDSAVVYGVPLDLTYEDYISNYLPSYGYCFFNSISESSADPWRSLGATKNSFMSTVQNKPSYSFIEVKDLKTK